MWYEYPLSFDDWVVMRYVFIKMSSNHHNVSKQTIQMRVLLGF